MNIRSSRAKQTLRSDSSPQQRCSGKGGRGGTYESIGLIWRANVDNIGEHISLNSCGDETGDDNGNDLSYEHYPRRDLHVMAKFKITRKSDGLVGPHVCNRFEDNIRNRSTREHVSGDHLMQHL